MTHISRQQLKQTSQRLLISIGSTAVFSFLCSVGSIASPHLLKGTLTPKQAYQAQGIIGGIGVASGIASIIILSVGDSRRKILKITEVAEGEEAIRSAVIDHQRNLAIISGQEPTQSVQQYQDDEEYDEDDDRQVTPPPKQVKPSPVPTIIPQVIPQTPVYPPVAIPSHSVSDGDWNADEMQFEEIPDFSDTENDLPPFLGFNPDESLMLKETPVKQLSPIAEKIGEDLEAFAIPKIMTHWFIASPTRSGKTTALKAIIWAWWTHFNGNCDIYIVDPKNEKTGWMGLECVYRVLVCAFDDHVPSVLEWVRTIHETMELRNSKSGTKHKPLFFVIDEFTDLRRRFIAYDKLNKTKLETEFVSKIISLSTTGAGVKIHVLLVGHSLNIQSAFGSLGDSNLRRNFIMGALGRESVTFDAISDIFSSSNIMKDKAQRDQLRATYETLKKDAKNNDLPIMISTQGQGSVFALPHIKFVNPSCDDDGDVILDRNERPINYFFLKGLEQYEPKQWINGKPHLEPTEKQTTAQDLSNNRTSYNPQENEVTYPRPDLSLVPNHVKHFHEVVTARSLGQSLTQWEGDKVTVTRHDFGFIPVTLPSGEQMTPTVWLKLINLIRDGKESKEKIIEVVFQKKKGSSDSYKRYQQVYEMAKQYVPYTKPQRYGQEWTFISKNAKKATNYECTCCNRKATETHHALYSDAKGKLLLDNVFVGIHIFPLCDDHHRYYHEYKNADNWVLDSMDSVRFNHQQIDGYIELCRAFDAKIQARYEEQNTYSEIMLTPC